MNAALPGGIATVSDRIFHRVCADEGARLLQQTAMPVVTTLRTVLDHPTPG